MAAYCETDVIGTYWVWLVYELFRGTMTRAEFDASEADLMEFVTERVGVKPYLRHVLRDRTVTPAGGGEGFDHLVGIRQQ